MKTQLAIQKFLDNRRAQNLKPKSIAWYEAELKRFAGAYPELPTEPEPVEEFLTNIEGVPETKHAYYRALKAFYRFLKRRHGLPNPIEYIGPPRCPAKIMPTLEAREIMQLLNSVDSPRDKALLTLFVDNGARVSELTSLREQDIKEGYIKVRGKRGEREIPISDETRHLLLTLVASNGRGELVFTHPDGQPLSRYSVYRTIRKVMGKVGIRGPKLGPHRIRHAFGKGYLVNGGDVRSLQQIMGHANITTTQKYAALNLSDTIDKHHRFTPLRAAHAAAQESFFDAGAAVREAEEILTKKEAEKTLTKKGVEETLAKKKVSNDTVSVGKTPPLPGLS